MIIVELFRDVFDGFWYFVYLFVCILAFFYVLGILADNKRAIINKKLKEKKTYDIESGREAEIAAMETKQVLTVGEDAEGITMGDLANANAKPAEEKEEKKEEIPAVMVLNSDGSSGTANQPTQPGAPQIQMPNVQPAGQPTIAPPSQTEPQTKAAEPLVINSN